MQQLPPSSVRLLSSGPVVTSVASIVKELVENALDAAATKIDVKLEKFGFDRIDVQDNGVGIPTDDVSFMALPHYTSKITTSSDIDALTTYGFRGEALSSMAAVADLSITTKTEGQSIGVVYKFDHNGNMESSKPIVACTGTTVVITNLFKKLLVRRQIGRNEKVQKRDLKQVEELLMHFGLAWPQTRFSMYHNRCLIWSKTSVSDIDSALTEVCGGSWTGCMQKVQIQDEKKQICFDAFLPKAIQLEASSDSTRNRRFTLVNGRPVVMKEIDKVIRSAFLQVPTLKEKSNVLGYCISLTLPLSSVDVNLEPNKTKVMLQDKEKILALLSEVLEKVYGEHKLHIDPQNTESINNFPKSISRLKTRNPTVSSEELSDNRDTSIIVTNPDSNTVELLTSENQNLLPQNKIKSALSSTAALCDEEEFCDDVSKSMCSSLLTTDHPDPLGAPNDGENASLRTKLPTVRTNCLDSMTDDIVDEMCAKLNEHSECQLQSEGHNGGLEKLHINSNSLGLHQICLPVESRATTDNIVNGVGSRSMTEEEFDMETEVEIQLETEKQNDVGMTWRKGTITDAANQVMQPVQLLNSVSKRPLSPTPDVGDSRHNNSLQLNAKKKKCTDRTCDQPTLYTLSENNKPAKQHLSAYTLFARDIRLEVMNENPAADFSQISKLIYQKWQNLTKEEQNEYETKSSSSKIRPVSLKQRLWKDKTLSAKSENRPVTRSASCASKIVMPVKVVTVEFALDKFQAMMAERSKFRASKLCSKIVNGCQYIGPVAEGSWVCCNDKQLGLYNHLRAKEVLLLANMMAGHRISAKHLDCPLVLNESLVGGSHCWTTLMDLSSSPGIPPCYQFLDDPHLLSNGIKIKKWRDETTNSWQAQIVGLADCMAFFGIDDLKTILNKLCINRHLTLEETRPLKVVSYFKEQVVRMVRQLPCKISKDDVVTLNNKLEKMPLPSRTTCLHGHDIFVPIFKMPIVSPAS